MRLCNRVVLTLAVLGFVVAGMPAAPASKPEAPTTPAAKAARKKFDAAVAKADEQRRLAVVSATRIYVKELEAALRIVAAAGKTEEVTRIAAALDKAKQDLDRDQKRSANDKPKTGRAYAAKGWQSALAVKQGQVLRITASGKWAVSDRADQRSGPDGFDVEHAGYRYGTLLARVGDETFVVGAEAEIEVPADGTLELVCHDAENAGDRDNNSGYVDVKIVVVTAAKASEDAEGDD